jgi:hypothetical protein
MRVSIIAEDDCIVVDKVAKLVDCRELIAKEISAIQWYGDHGEIEFVGHKKPNEVFHSFEEFQSLVTAAKPIPSPKPPTPQELDEMHNRFMLEHPNARQAWDQRDAEVRRLQEVAHDPGLRPPPLPAPEPPPKAPKPAPVPTKPKTEKK